MKFVSWSPLRSPQLEKLTILSCFTGLSRREFTIEGL
jgi:hypothetical protein